MRRAEALAEVEAQSRRVDAERAQLNLNMGRRGCLSFTVVAILIVIVGATGSRSLKCRAAATRSASRTGCVLYRVRPF
jgi:hypothetical protein